MGVNILCEKEEYEVLTADDVLFRLKKESKFCRVCGKSVEELQKMSSDEPQKPMKKCICGAMVPGGQFMCFECGRKVE